MAAAAAPLRIVELGDSTRDLKRFWQVMVGLSGNHPACVLPLRGEFITVLSPKNPFWSHARRRLWIAERNGRPVGRIAGILDDAHQRVHQDRTGFFGFWESAEDLEAATALFETVSTWARNAGCQRLRGPLNPSINEECGLLISGFDQANAIMMPHTPPHLPRLIEACGFAKAKDLVGFQIALSDSPAERLATFRKAAGRRAKDVRLIPVTSASLASVLPGLKEIYNTAWEQNWSAVPMTAAEIDFLALRLKPLLVKGLVWLAESNGRAAGLLVAVPDVNEVLRPLRGRLLSPALLRALPVLLGWRCPRRFRLVALGVTAEQRGRGIEGMMFAETLAAAQRRGFTECEASWVLEDNQTVHRLIEIFGGRIGQVFRLYDRAL